MIGIPTVADARAWCGVSVTAVSDDDLQQILDAELDIQSRLLDVPDDVNGDDVYPDALCRSLLRRVQRQVAAKNVPLGLVGGEANEWAPVGMQSWDAEIQRLEASYVIPVVS